MSDIKNQSRYRGMDRRGLRTSSTTADASAGPAAGEKYGDLLKRSEKLVGRHAAITNSLYSWHSYKNWAQKMRDNFDKKD